MIWPPPISSRSDSLLSYAALFRSGSQDINVFDRSWYGRVLVERVENLCGEAEWRRAYDEINEFEAQQIDSGTNIVKLFVHTTQQEQDERLAEIGRANV